MHDEWYWFRLLNGQSAPGSDTVPFNGSFDDIASVYEWARMQIVLPLDLRWAGSDRLYSPEFYAKSLNEEPRSYGLGTIYRFPRRETPDGIREEIWAFELEYSDNVSPEELKTYFETLFPTLPPTVGNQLKWLVRSPPQESTAQNMEQNALPYADRILRYDEITVAGEVEVYSGGLAAGRLRVVRAGESGLEDSTANDILVVEEIPDYLPPCAALITARPQTPLAHINVLARNRGIPNLYVAGILEDPGLDAIARIRAPGVLKAIIGEGDEPASYVLKAISEADFSTWRSLSSPPDVAVPATDLETAPYTIDLLDANPDAVDELRPLVGGKSAGFLGLLAPPLEGLPSLDLPHAPFAITARVFHEHRALYQIYLNAMLSDFEFRRSARARFLVLEGEDAFVTRYAEEGDANFLAAFLNDREEGNLVGDLVRLGGLVSVVENTPVDVDTMNDLREVLVERYAGYAITQGLRFRSSSTVEDIEGFNGAGLYTSNTGFLFPELQDNARDRGRSVENALLKTFSSYWGAEAFEERELANVVHESGHMAVLVHARFDDDKEVSNGVFTFTVLPPLPPQDASAERIGDVFLLEVNVQKGELSVTNPPPGSDSLPEVFEILQEAGEEPRVIRLSPSTEVPAGTFVFSDAKALRLFEDAKSVTTLWLERENSSLLSAQESRTITLDFEMREMDHGWPALDTGGSFSRRVVIKQARSLEPGLLALPNNIISQPLPRDVLARAAKVERIICESETLGITLVEVYTDAGRVPNLGYAETPFTGFATFSIHEAIVDAELIAGRRFSITHTALNDVTHPGLGDGWSMAAGLRSPYDDVFGFNRFSIDSSALHLNIAGADHAYPLSSSCSHEVQYATPAIFLESLLTNN
ncbi:MAG: hypothetical protein GY822_27295 [Deltaproteobacteria bacterium]|nr:hypothetical protein [Deltaproteobacteria bacterium]